MNKYVSKRYLQEKIDALDYAIRALSEGNTDEVDAQDLENMRGFIVAKCESIVKEVSK